MTSVVIIWAFLGFLVSTTLLMMAPTLFGASVAMVGRGFCFEICRTGTIALLQINVPDEMRGRLMSMQFFFQQGASAAGVAIIGASAERFGLRGPILCGVGFALFAWVVTLSTHKRIATAFVEPAER